MKLSSLRVIILAFACLAFMQPAYLDTCEAKTVKKASKSVKKKSGISGNTSRISRSRQKDENRELWLKRAAGSEILTGKASWYGKDFHNKKTASGVLYDMHTFTAAHRTLPMGTVVKVTDQLNGKSVMVAINDRGPFVKGRIIDLSYAAAKKIGLNDRGVGKVALEVVSDPEGKPLQGNKAYYVRYVTQNGRTKVGPFSAFADATAMREALSQAHSDVEVVLDEVGYR